MSFVLGEEAVSFKYGLGLITEIGPIDRTGITVSPEWIGFTPYVAGYQMKFNPNNLRKIDR